MSAPPPDAAAQAGALNRAVDGLAALALEATWPRLLPRLEAGQPAVWGGGAWEAPLLYACGTLPLPLNELWREGSREAEAIGEQDFQVPGEYCSMIKAVLGRLKLLRGSPVRRIVHFGGACEPISIALELVRREGYELFCIEGVTSFRTSLRRDTAMVAAVASELDRLARWLTGAPADEGRLREELRRKNRVAAKARRVLELRLRDPSALSAPTVLRVLGGSAHYFCQPERFEAALERLVEALEARPPAPRVARATGLVFAGGAAAGLEIFDVIERSHGQVLGWVTFHSVERTMREDLPPLEAIARYLVESQQAGELGELGGAPALPRRDRIEDEVRRTGARGVAAAGVTGCPYNTILQQVEREHFKAQGVPLIALETSVHREPPTEEQIIKLRTFLEMLQGPAGGAGRAAAAPQHAGA
jgi:benzoyl-CoA reductase/2-hydroxyglutaryl-CoA dehydratase subunit BcrC/BadD/HgdB